MHFDGKEVGYIPGAHLNIYDKDVPYLWIYNVKNVHLYFTENYRQFLQRGVKCVHLKSLNPLLSLTYKDPYLPKNSKKDIP